MTDMTSGQRVDHPLDKPSPLGSWPNVAIAVLLLVGLGYICYALAAELTDAVAVPWILLGLAMLIALGFEFVNGFHDTANAVATVIYTRSLPAEIAVIWSGFFNFLGVLFAVFTGASVAFGIISLLPVELIMQVGGGAGMAMVFALLLAAIIWNLGTWYLGLPASSSHTMVGSIIGVGLANQFLAPAGSHTSGVDWSQASSIGLSLLVSPIFGFVLAALLLLLMKVVVPVKALYQEPKTDGAPPTWIRGLLVLTCTLVSFFHGSNDGQKGMGLIMLILIGVVPTSFALNRTPDVNYLQTYKEASAGASAALAHYAKPGIVVTSDQAKELVSNAVKSRTWSDETTVALRQFIDDTGKLVSPYGSASAVPSGLVENTRNNMYLIGEALKLIDKRKLLPVNDTDLKAIAAYHASTDKVTRFIPIWVGVAVALALGLGTMVGWKRIVVTVGEKIGKTHLTYGQGAAAEIVAAATIGAADGLGLPVSTTHVLSSGVAGTMLANGSGLQMSTVRNLIMAWVLTLPVSMALSFLLFVLLRQFV